MPADKEVVRQRISAALRHERGFTLVELLVVVIVIAILGVLAMSTFRTYQARAHDTAAQQNIFQLLPSMQAYFVDHDGYSGMTIAGLATYDAAIKPSTYSFGTVAPTQSTYCVHSSSGSATWRKNGPDADLQAQTCP